MGDIAREIGRSRSTIESFHKRWTKHHVFRRKRGRSKTLSEEIQEDIVRAIILDRRLPVRPLGIAMSISREGVHLLRHKSRFHFYDSIPVPPLIPDAMRARVLFCQAELARDNNLHVVFTDESTVTQNTDLGGIWRRRGEFVDEARFEKRRHEIAAMVWGGDSTWLSNGSPTLSGESKSKVVQAYVRQQFYILSYMSEIWRRRMYLAAG
jgi:hypothetical protein